MQHDGGYFEEGQLDKQRDLRLLARLLPFLTPYRAMLAASVALVLLLTALDLTLPYLTKMAIDRYIVPVQIDTGPGSRFRCGALDDQSGNQAGQHVTHTA